MSDAVTSCPLVLESYVPGLLSWLHNKYASDGSEVYRNMFDIGIAEWNVLSYLGIFDIGIGSEMSRFLGMDKAAVSRAAASLKEKQLLSSVHRDKRTIEFTLTPLGKQRYNDVKNIALKREQVLLSGMTEAERRATLRLLHKMLENLEKVHEFGDELRDRFRANYESAKAK